jgi:outer membrane lipoprotein
MKSVQARFVLVVLVLIISMSACSTHIPPEIKQPIEGAPGIGQVRDQPDAHLSRKVRWGGVILDTENQQDTSSLTIVAFPLRDNGEPRVSDQSTGRFIALVDEFLEPTVFTSEREITVTGTVLKTQTRDVGEFAYEYPVIQVQNYYIWPVKEDPTYVHYPPYWWYDPWYPYYPIHYPHHYPHHHQHRR